MNGPKPVWMFATNRLNQSSPRLAAASTGCAEPAPCRRLPAWAQFFVLAGICSIGRRRRHEHSRAIRVLVLGRRLELLSGQLRTSDLSAARIEVQQRPIDGDAAGSHAEKAAEIDDRDSHVPLGVREHIDHPAQILSLRALDFLAQNRGERHARAHRLARRPSCLAAFARAPRRAARMPVGGGAWVLCFFAHAWAVHGHAGRQHRFASARGHAGGLAGATRRAAARCAAAAPRRAGGRVRWRRVGERRGVGGGARGAGAGEGAELPACDAPPVAHADERGSSIHATSSGASAASHALESSTHGTCSVSLRNCRPYMRL